MACRSWWASARRALAAGHAFLEADLIKVVGKEIPERIYALVGGRELRQSPGFAEFEAHHVRGLERYRARDWEGRWRLSLLRCCAAIQLERRRNRYGKVMPAGVGSGILA
jgi:hypothetical protein